MLVFGKLTDGA